MFKSLIILPIPCIKLIIVCMLFFSNTTLTNGSGGISGFVPLSLKVHYQMMKYSFHWPFH